MHEFQPKHFKLSKDDKDKLLTKLNISLSQLPKISQKDPALPEACQKGDVVRIERKFEDAETEEYFRVVV